MNIGTPQIVAADDPADQPTYEAGYKKPPKQTRFKKGQSGNPRGVRKAMSIEETAAILLGRTRIITENGKPRRASMQELKKGIEGDNKAAKMVPELGQKAPTPESGKSTEEADAEIQEAIQGLSTKELEGVDAFLTNLRNVHCRRDKPK